uniref:RING-type E3 ubiquitin transferase n=1 Tax=Rhizophora mucronata TaxID=61149 RepID=A0A2P2KVY8_RHIMU
MRGCFYLATLLISPDFLFIFAAYGSFSLVDVFADKLLSQFPMYYRMKFALLLWLQLPSVEGAKQLYKNCLRPIFLRHQVWVDTIMGFVNGEMMANETVRSTRADERIRTTFMAGTSSIRAHEERVNETVRSTRENERSSIREPTEGKFDGSNGIVGCVICQEQLLGGDEVTGMPCSHVFHVKCIEKWLEQSRSCPLCRLDLP